MHARTQSKNKILLHGLQWEDILSSLAIEMHTQFPPPFSGQIL